jgi:Domain of unknown function (DUF1942)
MQTKSLLTSAAAAGATVVIGVATAATASAWWPNNAQAPTIQKFGTQEDLVDGAGTIVQGWTVYDLRPSSDVIPYPVRGRLWQARATDEAIRGTNTPLVSDMNARAPNGQTYRAIFNVPLPQGINAATMAQGGRTSGKLYFDVTGQNPDAVVYNNSIQDLLIWVR